MKKATWLIAVGFALLTFGLVQCNGNSTEEKKSTEATEAVVNKVTPVPLAKVVPGFNFPEDSNTIYKWVNDKTFANSYDSTNIYKHAWGVWAGLTAPSGETFAGDNLLVYETWLGLSEVQQLILDKNTQGGCVGEAFNRNGRALLSRPKQFEHAARFAAKNTAMLAKGSKPMFENAGTFWVTVSYSPDAACFATQNQIFRQSVINKYYNANGFGAIPPFPAKSLTIKPSYLIYSDTSKLFRLPVWATAPTPPNTDFFGNANSFVFVDKNNKQPAGKIAIPVDSAESNAAKIAAATVNLSDFIYLTVDQQMANYMNKQDSTQGMNSGSNGYGTAKKGQIALLVAMHVTTKEISNWTWQSYYWTPNRNQPGAPSSNLAASLRPSQITGAAANYACVAAYLMLTPNNAENNNPKAGPMFGYNPYLEAGFGPGVFTFANTYNKAYQYGTQSNCMSCHALAIPDPTGQYTTDQNISLYDSYFKKQVSVDFAWSIQTALINDAKPYWQP